MIDVGKLRLRNDSVQMDLESIESAMATDVRGDLVIDVAYVHAGRWIVWSDRVSCSLIEDPGEVAITRDGAGGSHGNGPV